MQVFVGRFEHSLDQKGRVVLPVSFREHFAAGCYVAQGKDRCLSVFRPDDFETEARRLVQKVEDGREERSVLRAFAANASLVKPDTQGRIPIPPHLREYAGLQREVVVNGAIESVEIWDKDTFSRVETDGQARLAGA